MNWYLFLNTAARVRHAVSTRLAGKRAALARGNHLPLTSITEQLQRVFRPVTLDGNFRRLTRDELMQAYSLRNAKEKLSLLRRLSLDRPETQRSLVAAALLTSLVGSVLAAVLTLSTRRRQAEVPSS